MNNQVTDDVDDGDKDNDDNDNDAYCDGNHEIFSIFFKKIAATEHTLCYWYLIMEAQKYLAHHLI